VWQCISVIPALRRLRQEDREIKASLGYTDQFQNKSVKMKKHREIGRRGLTVSTGLFRRGKQWRVSCRS
jgi:hypothetical protein